MFNTAIAWKGLKVAPFWTAILIASSVPGLATLPVKATEVQGVEESFPVTVPAKPIAIDVQTTTTAPATITATDKTWVNAPVDPASTSVKAPTTIETNQVLTKTDAISNQSDPVSANHLLDAAIATNQPTPMAQVTSVSQLTDVQPTDWAFQALQSLVERYGCIVGYPDSTFRGHRALTRYEFAAGLNACMDRVNELIAAGTANLVTKADLATLQRLQEEFAAELVTVRGRVDTLEAHTAELEAQQFSTTTKLSGLVWFNLTDAFTSGGDVKFEAAAGPGGSVPGPTPEARFAGRDPITRQPFVQRVRDAEATLSNLVWLTLSTSFTGKDSLVTQLAAGNGISPVNVFASAGLFNTFGVPFTDQTAGATNGLNNFVIREFFYSFPVANNVQVTVGPRVNWYRYFDFNRFTFFLTGAGSFNAIGSTQTNTLDRGSGAVVVWDISQQLRFAAAYLGENTEFLPASLFNSSSNPRQGLFGGTNTLTAELTLSPSDTFNLRLLYNRSNIQSIFGQVGGAIGEPLSGLADDGLGGPLDNATADTFSANFDWLLTPRFGIFGRYAYGSTHLFPLTPGVPGGDVNSQSFQAGVGFPDLGKQGALAVVSVAVPFDVRDGRQFLVAGGGNGGTQYEIEASYFLPVTDDIAVVPAFYAIVNPNNFSDNPTIYVGNFRTQFSF